MMAIALLTAGSAQSSDGVTVFTQNCAFCHQSDAGGLNGQYPRLAGRVGRISGKAQGRTYLIDVVTFGMTGQITVDKQSIIGVMPALQLSDDDAAAVLTYLAGLRDARATPFTAAEVAAQRAMPPKTSADVHAERQRLQSAKIVE